MEKPTQYKAIYMLNSNKIQSLKAQKSDRSFYIGPFKGQIFFEMPYQDDG